MSAYTTLEIDAQTARNFLLIKIMVASNEQLADMMDLYGNDDPYYLNNFIVSDRSEDDHPTTT